MKTIEDKPKKNIKKQNKFIHLFSRVLTFPVRCKYVQNGIKSKKIQHIVLAKKKEGEYTLVR